jgi:hypothetical protein
MINLLPPEYKEEISYGRKNRKTLSWATTVGFGILSLLVVTFVGRATIESAKGQAVAQKASIEDQIKQTKLSDTEKQYASFINSTNNVKKIYSQEVLYSRLIRKLATLLPPDSKLTNISLTDKDKALNLNFSNSKDGLGPVILVNLQNQGIQVSAKTISLVTGAFAIPIGYDSTLDKNGQSIQKVSIDPKTKQIEYFIEVGDSKVEQDKLASFKNALKNGGEFSYELVKNSIASRHLGDEVPPSGTPKFTGYSINGQNRSVDFSFSANSSLEVSNQTSLFTDNANAAFIETYMFEDKDYIFSGHCTDKTSRKKTCETVCSDSGTTCTDDQKICHPLVNRGCRYIIRGYYDELYTTAVITPTSSKEKEACKSLRQLSCTHKVTAKYNQLFDNVDINKTSACSVDATGAQKCLVDIRAQFSPDAKFYFVNTSGVSS